MDGYDALNAIFLAAESLDGGVEEAVNLGLTADTLNQITRTLLKPEETHGTYLPVKEEAIDYNPCPVQSPAALAPQPNLLGRQLPLSAFYPLEIAKPSFLSACPASGYELRVVQEPPPEVTKIVMPGY